MIDGIFRLARCSRRQANYYKIKSSIDFKYLLNLTKNKINFIIPNEQLRKNTKLISKTRI